ncbi:hypothetical protein OOK29_21720 [Streptomyces phaeochromogenes]|uniref:hypothetical protein n=1 Tax=Streptomyces phaeochromogenes TaxID=1923 RepID=UPI00224DDE25|nr:hypothetical protein [Streptomyces phaeochromogenes]MCX5600773.1 hypothetical protein [Streptomyces phaeochromogenes]
MRSAVFARATRIAAVGATAAALTVGLATSASAATVTRSVTVSGTTYNLSLTAPDALSAAGQNIAVSGSGYNTIQGVYVGLCVIPDGVVPGDPSTYTSRPTPCLGGADQTGTTGASHWVSNFGGGTVANSSAYGSGGSFNVSVHVNPNIATGQVCGTDVDCAIVTRADHTASGTRSYDVYIPVTFS